VIVFGKCIGMAAEELLYLLGGGGGGGSMSAAVGKPHVHVIFVVVVCELGRSARPRTVAGAVGRH